MERQSEWRMERQSSGSTVKQLVLYNYNMVLRRSFFLFEMLHF